MKQIQQYNNIRNKKIACCGIFTAMAMIFSYIEILIPNPIPVPGIKLGLANIAIITILYTVGVKEACMVNILRIILMSVLFGNINSFIFSMTGGMISLLVMVILKKLGIFGKTGVSVAGAVMHNFGQILAAMFIMSTSAIIYYLPVLIASGTLTGIIIGLMSSMVIKRIHI